MSWVAALIVLATGVFLPTFDVYSDLFFTSKLFAGNYYNNQRECTYSFSERWERWERSCVWHECESPVPSHPKFGSAMLTPFLLSWLFVTIQWFKTERGLRQKLKTLPLLIFQVYPQWRALRVLFYAKWKRDNRWQRMKEEWETGITHLGKIIKINAIFGVVNL